MAEALVTLKGGLVSISNPSAAAGKLVSELVREDPSMRELVLEFVNTLDDRIAELQQAYERLDWQQLAKLAHQLKGAGGSYGYPELSELAATMEQHFRTQSVGSFKHWIEQLAQLGVAARAGLQDG
jgi:HPt (histidine-containing phosphotransfer) domain-containing protein